MDKFIEQREAEDFGDLMIGEGFAYQKDMSGQVDYGVDYFQKYCGYNDTPTSHKINLARIDLVSQYHTGFLLDVGVGSGEFVRKRKMTMGYDINEAAVEWLKSRGEYSEDFSRFRAFSFWDVIEHIREPAEYFDKIRKGSFLFTSIPIIKDIKKVKEWKHYRPDEHYYYFTAPVFVYWMGQHGFQHIITTDDETKAGREDILSFAFIKR